MVENQEIMEADEVAVRQTVQEVLDECKSFISSSLDFYWRIGLKINTLDREYGSGAVGKFNKELTERLGRHKEFSTSTLYRASQFFNKFSESELQQLKEAGVSWSQIVKTLPVDSEVLKPIIERILIGELEPHRLAEAVEEMSAPDPAGLLTPDQDGPTANEPDDDENESTETDNVDAEYPVFDYPEAGDTPSFDGEPDPDQIERTINKVVNPINNLIELLPDVLISADAMDSFSDDEVKTAKQRLEEVLKLLTTLIGTAEAIQTELSGKLKG